MKRIGIVLRVEVCDSVNILQFHDILRTRLNNYEVNIIGIIPKSSEFYLNNKDSKTDFKMLEDSLKLCDGIILPGGYDNFDFDYYITKYCYDNDIPILGICLGMQAMAELLGGQIGTLPNQTHNITKQNYAIPVHTVTIDLNSKFYQIVKQEVLFVNSRHSDYISKINPNYVVGLSDDGIVEVIEDHTKRFFVGVQWHAEDMEDEPTKLLFNAFVDSIKTQ